MNCPADGLPPKIPHTAALLRYGVSHFFDHEMENSNASHDFDRKNLDAAERAPEVAFWSGGRGCLRRLRAAFPAPVPRPSFTGEIDGRALSEWRDPLGARTWPEAVAHASSVTV